MTFGLTAQGFKIKRLEDIITEKQLAYRNKFGDNFDVSEKTPAGQILYIEAEREAKLWELAQADYNSYNRRTAEGAQLDNALSLTGSIREGASYSVVKTGVARGASGTVVTKDSVISVAGNPTSKFKVLADAVINIADGPTFKSAYISLQALATGPVQALAGTLTVIDTPIAGMDSFTNELDAEMGADIETDAEAKLRADQELQLAGSATIEAIKSELEARPLVQKVLVFQNIYSIPDLDGRPPKSIDIVVLGDNEQDVADAIFKVVGGGAQTIGDISKTVIDSQGFAQLIKFSRPTGVDIWMEIDLVTDPNTFPIDGDDQVEALVLAWSETQEVGEDVIVFGTNGVGGSFDSVPGITDFNIRIGKTAVPLTDNNVVIAPREISEFDSSRILVNVI